MSVEELIKLLKKQQHNAPVLIMIDGVFSYVHRVRLSPHGNEIILE